MDYDWEMDMPDWDSEWGMDDDTDALTAEFEEIIDALLDYLEAIIGDEDAGWDEWGDDTMVM
jgi:hypothetical protein